MEETQKCSKCGEIKPITEVNKDGVCKTCKRDRRNTYKKQAIIKYGSKCQRCGFDMMDVLQFHHINGRKGAPQGGEIYFKLLSSSKRDDIQLLCPACHWAIHHGTEEHVLFLQFIGTLLNSALRRQPTKQLAVRVRWLKKQINK